MDKIITNDPFLCVEFSKQRLLEECRTHGKLIVAFDFDNTIYDYHKKGYKFNKVIDILKKSKEKGFYLICWTMSPNEEFIYSYLNSIGIECDSINQHYPGLELGSTKKIYYNILLDDRAGLAQTYDELNYVLNNI